MVACVWTGAVVRCKPFVNANYQILISVVLSNFIFNESQQKVKLNKFFFAFIKSSLGWVIGKLYRANLINESEIRHSTHQKKTLNLICQGKGTQIGNGIKIKGNGENRVSVKTIGSISEWRITRALVMGKLGRGAKRKLIMAVAKSRSDKQVH